MPRPGSLPRNGADPAVGFTWLANRNVRPSTGQQMFSGGSREGYHHSPAWSGGLLALNPITQESVRGAKGCSRQLWLRSPTMTFLASVQLE